MTVDHDRQGWRLRGSRRTAASSLFFSPHRRVAGTGRGETHTKRVCQDGRMLIECREYALPVAEPYGTWDRMCESERRRRTRRRQ
ncbi:WhiB family transcriptional regulator (plasmid) [Rhodococcus koreensis]|nr:WhiB family transcriptional regulator [Rhodococcus koreensis]